MNKATADFGGELSTEAALAVRLCQAGCLDGSLGFLTRQLRTDGYSMPNTDLSLGIEKYRGLMPQCFAESKPDENRTRRLLDAMGDGRADLMEALNAEFGKRREHAEEFKQSQRR